ncbi:uncharacterized protein LOC129229311 isoform X1 [Uloborus diversus]|uniref:uncharacterized protein LOC129229311 isoform X1 n=1 Tax=Uloborus diversus TaxID=327109 RepID=UPI00240A894E|nr:uncharacterized protein LOC129229311 isoform X1 [Uloborus diversus]
MVNAEDIQCVIGILYLDGKKIIAVKLSNGTEKLVKESKEQFCQELTLKFLQAEIEKNHTSLCNKRSDDTRRFPVASAINNLLPFASQQKNVNAYRKSQISMLKKNKDTSNSINIKIE